MSGADDGSPHGQPEPLGAPTDPLRPTGRVDEAALLAESRARLEAKARRVLRTFVMVLLAVTLLTVLFFTVVALLPKPDL